MKQTRCLNIQNNNRKVFPVAPIVLPFAGIPCSGSVGIGRSRAGSWPSWVGAGVPEPGRGEVLRGFGSWGWGEGCQRTGWDGHPRQDSILGACRL